MHSIRRPAAKVLALILAFSLRWTPLAAGSPPAPSAPGPSDGVLEAGGTALESQDGVSEGADASAGDYDRAEPAGEVAPSSEYRADGWIDHFKDGHLFGQLGSPVELRMAHGHKAIPGADYVVFREDGDLSSQGSEGKDVGVLLQSVGVLRVTGVAGEAVTARIVKQYVNMLGGDQVRLREPQRRKYYALLNRKTAVPKGGIKAEVVGLPPPGLYAVNGDIVYLNVGFKKGLVPGMRLRVVSTGDADNFPTDDLDSVMPMSSIGPLAAPEDDLRTVAPTGVLGTVEVVNATAGACAVRVVHCLGMVRVGDHVLYP